MVALPNLNGVKPSYGGDSGLPDGRHKVAIVASGAGEKLNAMGRMQSGWLELTLQVLEGPLTGQQQIERLTMYHETSAVAVKIGQEQLAAYCFVLGFPAGAQQSEQLHNRPLQIEVGRQIDKNTKQPLAFGEIKKIFDANGNEPGKAAQNSGGQGGQQPPPQTQPPAQVQPDGAGWGNNQGNGQQPPPQQEPPPAQPGNWGAPATTEPPPAQGGWNQGQPAAGGGPSWGAR